MIIIVLILFGLITGSFINAFVWRIHEQSKSKKPRKDLSILNGRSMCTHCSHQLVWYDLIPVFSWLLLRGKCRYCQKSIHWQYPLVELATALLFVLSYVLWSGSVYSSHEPFLIFFIVWLIVLLGFMALFVYDLRWMLLPDRIIFPLVILVSLVAIINISLEGWALLLQTVLSVLVASGIFWLIFQLSNGRWIGGGDVKLGLLIGLLLQSPVRAYLAIFIACIIGTLLIVPGLIVKRVTPKSRIPFGPFLIIATVIVFLFGTSIIDWYKDILLI